MIKGSFKVIFTPINHNLSNTPRFDLINEKKEDKKPSAAMLAALKRKYELKLIAELTKELNMMRSQIDKNILGNFITPEDFIAHFMKRMNELSALKSKYRIA